MILQMDEAYEPPKNETRTVYGLQLQVGFYQILPNTCLYGNMSRSTRLVIFHCPRVLLTLKNISNIETMSRLAQRIPLIPSSFQKTPRRSQNPVSKSAMS